MTKKSFRKIGFISLLSTSIPILAGALRAEVEDLVEEEKQALPEVPASMIEALGHEEFKKRHAGQRDLLVWGKKDLKGSITSLYRVYREAEDPEVRLRSLSLIHI